MSEKQPGYDAFLVLSDNVVEVLTRLGQCDSKTIARELRRAGHLTKRNSINRVLTDYLSDRVERCGKDQWRLVVRQV